MLPCRVTAGQKQEKSMNPIARSKFTSSSFRPRLIFFFWLYDICPGTGFIYCILSLQSQYVLHTGVKMILIWKIERDFALCVLVTKVVILVSQLLTFYRLQLCRRDSSASSSEEFNSDDDEDINMEGNAEERWVKVTWCIQTITMVIQYIGIQFRGHNKYCMLVTGVEHPFRWADDTYCK